jgi:hypothetical protein
LMRCPSKRKRTAPGWRDLREQKAVKICEEEGGRGVSARKYAGMRKNSQEGRIWRVTYLLKLRGLPDLEVNLRVVLRKGGRGDVSAMFSK